MYLATEVVGADGLEKAKETFEQEFWIEWELAEKVSVAGEFNQWKSDEFWLQRDDKGIWRGTKTLKLDN